MTQRVRQARDLSQVFSFSGSQDSSHSPQRAGAGAVLTAVSLLLGRVAGGARGHGRRGDVRGLEVAWAAVEVTSSMWTTVQCIHTKHAAVSRNRTKNVELGKPDHSLV